jgi:hypothetical protein
VQRGDIDVIAPGYAADCMESFVRLYRNRSKTLRAYIRRKREAN